MTIDHTGPADAIAGLRQVLAAVEAHISAQRLAPVRQLVARTEQRQALPVDHTIVALAGPTGCGKSSLFNALAGEQLSPVSPQRPTTGEAYACVWGAAEAAAGLLDWLKVAPARRSAQSRRLDSDNQKLRGLVLLDLPDFDSLDTERAVEVKRLLSLADVVVWVLDPQKYADKVVHEQHLAGYRHHWEVTLVVLNQADLLAAADLRRLLADLQRLLAQDGLATAHTIATSTVQGSAGVAPLRAELTGLLAADAPRRRIAADAQHVAEQLTELVGPAVTTQTVDSAAGQALTDGLARVAGVLAVAETVETRVRRRGSVMTAWPPLRWAARLRPDSLRRLTAAPGPVDPAETAPTGPGWAVAGPTHIGGPRTGAAPGRDLGQQAAAGLVAREVATYASAGLPDPWPEAAAVAARSQLHNIPTALEAAVTTVGSIADRTPLWWRLVAAGQWLLIAAVLIGLGWSTLTWLLPVGEDPTVAGVPVVWVTGCALLAGAALAAAAQLLLRRDARRARQRAGAQLRLAVSEVGRAHVLTPMNEVLHAYARAREVLGGLS